MINYDTILSSYDDKLTLMQWLKKVEAALKDASATGFHVNKRGNATITFSIDFANGETLESEPLVLQQGESVASAYIQNGNLHLVLTNGDDLDAGNMLNGDITLTGNFAAASVKTPSLSSDAPEISAQKPVVEVMTGYAGTSLDTTAGLELTPLYMGAVKNGNKLTLAYFGTIKRTANVSGGYLDNKIRWAVPYDVATKIGVYTFQGVSVCGNGLVNLSSNLSNNAQLPYLLLKTPGSGTILLSIYNINNLSLDETYFFRVEATFLLSDSLVS